MKKIIHQLLGHDMGYSARLVTGEEHWQGKIRVRIVCSCGQEWDE